MKHTLAVTACLGALLAAGCRTHTQAPGLVAPVHVAEPPRGPTPSTPAVSARIPSTPLPAAPPTVQIAADVATLPHHTFSGIFQKDPPQSLWTLDHYHSQGYPVISPDGRWLVLTRTGDWFRHGEWLVVVDLKNRTALEQRVPPPGLTPPAVFSLDGTLLLGVVNTPRGHGLARWKMPSLEVSIADLGEGVAISATFTHKQDRVLVMREGGDVTVYDLADGRKRLEVAPHDPSAKFYNSALAVSPDDQLVAAGIIQPGNQWVLWRLDTGERVPATPTKQHLSWGRVAAFDRTGEHIFTGASGWSILSPASGERLFSFPGNGGEAFHYQPTQDLLSAAIGDGRSFGIVNVATGQLVFSVAHAARPPAPLGYADWAAVSPDGKTAYSANYFSVFAWDLTVLERRKPDWLFAGQSAGRLLPIENGARLLALGERLEVWNLATRKLERVQRLDALGLHQSYESVSPEKRRRMIGNFRAGSSLVGIVASGEVAETFDLTTGRRGLALGRTEAEIMAELQTLVSKPNVTREEMIRQGSQLRAEVFPRGGGGDGALSMDASPDGKWLLVTDPQSREHLASLWSLETGHLIRVLGVRSDGPAARVVRMLDRGRLAVIGDDNGGLGFYELNTGDLISRSDGMPSRDNYGVSRAQITEVLATADGKVIYTSDRNQRIARWERFAEGWRKRYEIEFPSTAPLVRLALSPGGTRLAADLFNGSMNGFIAVIGAASGAVRSILNEDTWDVAFVSENQLATSGVRIWTIE